VTPEEKIRQEVSEIVWWHEIDLGPCITPGEKPTITGEDEATFHTRIPEEIFRGKSVLDIGAWDGFYSFLAERCGARYVMATDEPAWQKQPGYEARSGKAGFDYACKTLGSFVESEVCPLEELPWYESFDLVLFFGVYYHLHDPIAGITQAVKQVKPGGVILIEGHVSGFDLDHPMMECYPDGEHRGDRTTYWAPNPLCMEAMLQRLGCTATSWEWTKHLDDPTARDDRALFFVRKDEVC